MGNTESSCAYLSSLHAMQEQFRSVSGEPASASTFVAKVDYLDPSMEHLLPPTASTSGSRESAQGPHVTCLMTSTATCVHKRAALERSAHTARLTTHPNVFRCVKSNENATKQFTMIGAPQVEWLTQPTSTVPTAPSAPHPQSSGKRSSDGHRLAEWSVSETIFGVSGVVDAVATLLSMQHQSVLTTLRLHQVSVAMHRGVSATADITVSAAAQHSPSRDDEAPATGVGGSRPGGLFDASFVHAGRWILHDLTTFEQAKHGTPIGTTLRSVALFVLEVLGSLGQHGALRSELFDVVRRSVASSCAPPAVLGDSSFAALSLEDGGHDGAAQQRQHSVEGTPAEFSAEMEQNNTTGGGGEELPPRAADGPEHHVIPAPSRGGASATLVAMRTVESIFSILVEDIRLVVERSNIAVVSGSVSDDGGVAVHDNGSSAGTNSSPPSRSSATPVHGHLEHAPSFSGGGTSMDSGTTSSGVERLLNWLHYALMDSVHHADYLQPSDVVRLLEELRDILRVALEDPLCTLLRHGQSLYLYTAHDEHNRNATSSGPTTSQAAQSGGVTHKLDAYEEMTRAAYVIQREYMSSNTGSHSGGGPSSTTTSSSSGRTKVQSVWERRILRWLLHPSHVAQRESHNLLDYIFSTVRSPTALVPGDMLEALAVEWLTGVRNPTCRAAALRYCRTLSAALPPERLGGLLTTASFVLMQGRLCLSRLTTATVRKGGVEAHAQTAPVAPPLTGANATVALHCVRAYVEATPALVEELLCSPYVDTIDRKANRVLLQNVLLKELALLLRSCAVVDDQHVLETFGHQVHQVVVKLLKQVLLTMAELAAPCLQRIATSDFRTPLEDVLPSALLFVASCGFGVSYGTTESRERVFSVLSTLLLHGHQTSSSPSAVDERIAGRCLPVSAVLILRWWLPMVTPLCGSSDQRLRQAACHIAGSLTGILASLKNSGLNLPLHPTEQRLDAPPGSDETDIEVANGVDGRQHRTPSSSIEGSDEEPPHETAEGRRGPSPPPSSPPRGGAAGRHICPIPMFHDVYRRHDEDLQGSHGEDIRTSSSGSIMLSPECLQQRFIGLYHKATYVVCFTESGATRNDSQPPVVAKAVHASGGKACGVPSKDFLNSVDGKRTMFYCLGGRVNHDDTLLPQPFY